jgi:L-fucose isomerase
MKVGIITFTDGRERCWQGQRDDCFRFQGGIADWLTAQGHKVVPAQEIVWNWQTAREEALRMGDCDAVIFNFAVWSYPDFSAQSANLIDCPICFVGNINPAAPGWVAFFACAGMMDELGRNFGRVLGDLSDPLVAGDLKRWLADNEPDKRRRGEAAAAALKGQRYGEFDGPSMGMYTGHIDQSQWMEQFGVQVFHRSNLTLYWKMLQVAPERVEAGLAWLKDVCAEIQFDGEGLTDGLDGTLARQVRLYLAIKDLCREEGIDFMGLTGQLDWTEWDQGCIMDIPEAILNDNADWEDEVKPVTVCATECDSNAALTMQLLHLITKTPVLFADLRHYHADLDIYDLVNSGQHAPWLSHRSANYRDNWKDIRLMPASTFYFRGGGASVQFYADAEPTVTYARVTRKAGLYRCHIFTGSWVDYGFERNEELGNLTSYTWPHIWAKFDVPMRAFGKTFSANHLHAAIGNVVGELYAACEALGIEPIILGE